MFTRLLTLLISTEWQTFCGLSREDFRSLATGALDDLGYEYTSERIETSSSEEVWFGSDEQADRITVSKPEPFTIDVITATADPVTSVGLKLIISEKRRNAATDDLSFVTVSETNATTRPVIARFFARVIERADEPPWKVNHHLAFRLAILLRLKVKILWKYWIDVDATTSEPGVDTVQ